MKIYCLTLLAVVGCTLLSSSAYGQSFNIDVSNLSGVPTTNYGAAAEQDGFWNVLSGGPPYVATLKDLEGVNTTVTTHVDVGGNGSGDIISNNPSTSGGDEALMDDLQDVGEGSAGSATCWTFSGLTIGTYDVYVYAWAPNGADVSTVSLGFVSGTEQLVGGPWPNGFVPGVTHAEYTTTIWSPVLEICVDAGSVSSNSASVNGFQLKLVSTFPFGTGTPVCFGNSGYCCTPGAPNAGCNNSAGTGGCVLTSSGIADTTDDTFTLTANGAVNQAGLFFQGNVTIGGGSGLPFGEGIRCCGDSIVRIQVVDPPGAGTPCTHQMTGTATTSGPAWTISPGDTRCYQIWYRDPGSTCASNPEHHFNLSNAISVTWI